LARLLVSKEVYSHQVVSYPLLRASGAIGAEWKRPKAALPLAITTLALAAVVLGGYIAYAGGPKEFRFEPGPELRTEEHHEH
jgi:hypothetical protein